MRLLSSTSTSLLYYSSIFSLDSEPPSSYSIPSELSLDELESSSSSNPGLTTFSIKKELSLFVGGYTWFLTSDSPNVYALLTCLSTSLIWSWLLLSVRLSSLWIRLELTYGILIISKSWNTRGKGPVIYLICSPLCCPSSFIIGDEFFFFTEGLLLKLRAGTPLFSSVWSCLWLEEI